MFQKNRMQSRKKNYGINYYVPVLVLKPFGLHLDPDTVSLVNITYAHYQKLRVFLISPKFRIFYFQLVKGLPRPLFVVNDFF
jgi:hypothetical protein